MPMLIRLFFMAVLLMPTVAFGEDTGHNRTSWLFYDGVMGSQVGPIGKKDVCDERVATLRKAYPIDAHKILDCWETDASFVVVRERWVSHWRKH